MRHSFINYCLLTVILNLLLVSCKKIESDSSQSSLKTAKTTFNAITANSGCSTHPIIDSMATPNYADSSQIMTVLGIQRTNPYLLANMRQAYNNLGYSGLSISITNYYVRFQPQSPANLVYLDSVMDAQGLELFDTPMDYDITQEGDYYQDPSIPDSSITWLYAVVPPSFQPPAGSTYQILAQIHIPTDDYTAVETEAERLASIQDSINCSGGIAPKVKVSHYVVQCQTGYHWDFSKNTCVCDCCPSGYHWDGSQCSPDNPPPPPPPPPPPAPDAAVPSGSITVTDTQIPDNNHLQGVRNARIVAKRWFKIERIYTDINGHFQCTKRFKHKVKINIKFKNSDASIRHMQGARFWQMLFPVKVTLGVFSGNKSNITYNFPQYGNNAAKGNVYWAAATTHNAVQEYKDLGNQENIGLPPGGLKIFLSRNGLIGNGGATPLFSKRAILDLPSEVVITYLSGPIGGAITMFVYTMKQQIDMMIGYKYDNASQFTSDNIKETVYHELTHAGHYNKLGMSWYTQFVNAEISEIISNFNGTYSPYGRGTDANAPIIALGESWAYHMGQYFADKKYGIYSSPAGEQFSLYSNNYLGNGWNAHWVALEQFDPNLSADNFHWIPKGLYFDIFDTRNEASPVIDQVSGYTNAQFFNAFSSSINTLQDYRVNLINQNPNNQSVQVTNLFAQYGY